MWEELTAIGIWILVGIGFVILGLYGMFSQQDRPLRFWANVQDAPIASENVRAYNRALGKLWLAYGIGFTLLGMPIFAGRDELTIVSTGIGLPLLTIAMIVIFMFGIEKKYRKK